MNPSLHYVSRKEINKIKTIEYLCGKDVQGFGRLFSSKSTDRNRKPILASPFGRHLSRVNQFLFSGGLSVDVVNTLGEDPRQDWINRQIRHMRLDSFCQELWNMGATNGEVFAVFSQARDKNGNAREVFDVQVFEKPEFNPVYSESGDLLKVELQSARTVKGEEYVYKAEYTAESYTSWGLIKKNDFSVGNFPDPVETPHEYGVVPGVVIRNSGDFRKRGNPQFDAAAIDMAISLVDQWCDASSSYHYFGQPIILSPDVKDTLKKLKARSRILEKLPEQDGGAPEILQAQPMPKDHPAFLERLSANLMGHLGTPDVETQGGQRDASSLTLKVLHAETIATSQSKWSPYVTFGICELLKKMLLAAAFEGVLGNVNPIDPETYDLSVARKLPFFPVSPAEKVQQLGVVEQLVQLGVRREDALSREFYTEMTSEQVLDLLEGDLL